MNEWIYEDGGGVLEEFSGPHLETGVVFGGLWHTASSLLMQSSTFLISMMDAQERAY